MLISELAARAGVSARALRHYEHRELLVAKRNTNGYRVYSESDIPRVQQIKAMIDAGLATSTIRRFIDCARSGELGTTLEMCPELRAAVDTISARIDQEQAMLSDTKQRLCALAGTS